MSRGLFIGRFQPFHYGHLAALKWILSREDEVIICIGSADKSYTLKNPFTVGERIEMIWRVLKIEKLNDRCLFTNVPDTGEKHHLWVPLLLSLTPSFDRAYSNDPLTRLLLKDSKIKVEKIPFYKREIYSATRIRKLMIEDGPWEKYVPEAVAQYIKEIGGDIRLKILAGNLR